MTTQARERDNKTLLVFNFPDRNYARGLAGFTIECKPPATLAPRTADSIAGDLRSHS